VPRSVIKGIDTIEELSLLKILHKKSVAVSSQQQFKEVPLSVPVSFVLEQLFQFTIE
jgi:hypothetical protein